MGTAPKNPKKRWRAVFVYHSKAGLISVEHFFEEIGELHDLIERGPNFYAIDHIRIEHTGEATTIAALEELESGGGEIVRGPTKQFLTET